MLKVIVIFDIGKTNKKCIVFDSSLNVVQQQAITIAEIRDEDGDLCDDIYSIQTWIYASLEELNKIENVQITAINFSTYGASLVHLNNDGNILTPLYNYLKPIDYAYIKNLYDTHGGVQKISMETASPPSGMLNSGIQMYWLKYHQPKVYNTIKYSLHLPQYFSYLFTGEAISDYTSIGCHTMIWDFETNSYHQWVKKEGINNKLAPIVNTDRHLSIPFQGQKIKVGAGIHDSSAALLPYLYDSQENFILISTGTWNVTLNPFWVKQPDNELNEQELLNYMTIDGKPIRASRIFLGNEYKIQVEKLRKFFNKSDESHKIIQFDKSIYKIILSRNKNLFIFHSLKHSRDEPAKFQAELFPSFEFAYHQLMHELVYLQVKTIKKAIGHSDIKTIYVDGGFVDNNIFLTLLSYNFKNYKIFSASSPMASAIGAALMVSNTENRYGLLNRQFNLQEIKPVVLET